MDGFSSRTFVRPLKSKNAATVAAALESIFDEFLAQIYVFETDRGSEFQGPTQKIFKERKIIYKAKYGKNKSFMSENYIRIVKKKLYMALRGTLNKNWVKLLEIVVDSMNQTPISRLGWMTPDSIVNEASSVIVNKAKKIHHIKIYKEPNFKTQLENQIKFDQSSQELQVGDYCYRDFDSKLFDKSYNVSVILYNFITTYCINLYYKEKIEVYIVVCFLLNFILKCFYKIF